MNFAEAVKLITEKQITIKNQKEKTPLEEEYEFCVYSILAMMKYGNKEWEKVAPSSLAPSLVSLLTADGFKVTKINTFNGSTSFVISWE